MIILEDKAGFTEDQAKFHRSQLRESAKLACVFGFVCGLMFACFVAFVLFPAIELFAGLFR